MLCLFFSIRHRSEFIVTWRKISEPIKLLAVTKHTFRSMDRIKVYPITYPYSIQSNPYYPRISVDIIMYFVLLWRILWESRCIR